MRTRSRLIPSSTIIPRATDLLSVYSLRGGLFRLCAGRSQCSKASVVNRTIGNSTARCLPSARCVLWPRASSARVWSRLSRVFPSQQRAGRGGFSLSTLDAPEVGACDHVDENARFKWHCVRRMLRSYCSVSCDRTAFLYPEERRAHACVILRPMSDLER